MGARVRLLARVDRPHVVGEAGVVRALELARLPRAREPLVPRMLPRVSLEVASECGPVTAAWPAAQKGLFAGVGEAVRP
jgi:hypothetical protein